MPEQPLSLDKIGFEQILLPDGSFRWVTVKTFEWTGGPDDAPALIEALRAHPAFRDNYCSPGEGGVSEAALHGPYRLDAVPVDAFVPVTEVEAEQHLDEWLSESVDDAWWEGLDADQRAEVQRSLHPVRDLLRTGGELLFLPYQGKEAEHDWGWVLWYFREWLVINRERGRLYEIACGLD